MAVSSQSCETHRVLNVLQIIFMNGVFMFALVLLFWTFGLSLMLSFAIGWICAPILTLCVGSMVYFADSCHPASQPDAFVSREAKPTAVHGTAAHLLDVWNADRQAERDEAVVQVLIGAKNRSHRKNDGKVVRMLEGDRASDKAEHMRETSAGRALFKAHPDRSDAFITESRKQPRNSSKRRGQA